MNISGCSLEDFQGIVQRVSSSFYSGNVTVQPDAHDCTIRKPRMVGRIMVLDSSGPGARRTWTGRRQPAACWHAYRDVLTALFTSHPDAVVRTMHAVYRGREGFLRDYPATGSHNVGSLFQPITMPELCECDGMTPYGVGSLVIPRRELREEDGYSWADASRSSQFVA